MELSAFMDSLVPFLLRGIYVANGINVEALDGSELDQYRKLFNKFNVEQLAYLLKVLIEIKESRNLEARLILLGYQGIRSIYPKSDETPTLELVDNTQLNAVEEKKSGQEEFEKSRKLSEEVQFEIIQDMSKPMDPNLMASTFASAVYMGNEILDRDNPNIKIISDEDE